MQLINGDIAADNSALVTQVVDEVGRVQRAAASGFEARALLGL
jgi:uncharacterized protein (DUF849 family)